MTFHLPVEDFDTLKYCNLESITNEATKYNELCEISSSEEDTTSREERQLREDKKKKKSPAQNCFHLMDLVKKKKVNNIVLKVGRDLKAKVEE